MSSVWLHMLRILIASVGGFLQRRIVDLSIQVSEADLRCKSYRRSKSEESSTFRKSGSVAVL
jgi:hypothetical protein